MCICVSLSLSQFLFVRLSVCLSLSICLSICLFVCLFICISVCMYVYMCFCPTVRLTVSLSLCVLVSFSLHTPFHPNILQHFLAQRMQKWQRPKKTDRLTEGKTDITSTLTLTLAYTLPHKLNNFITTTIKLKLLRLLGAWASETTHNAKLQLISFSFFPATNLCFLLSPSLTPFPLFSLTLSHPLSLCPSISSVSPLCAMRVD